MPTPPPRGPRVMGHSRPNTIPLPSSLWPFSYPYAFPFPFGALCFASLRVLRVSPTPPYPPVSSQPFSVHGGHFLSCQRKYVFSNECEYTCRSRSLPYLFPPFSMQKKYHGFLIRIYDPPSRSFERAAVSIPKIRVPFALGIQGIPFHEPVSF